MSRSTLEGNPILFSDIRIVWHYTLHVYLGRVINILVIHSNKSLPHFVTFACRLNKSLPKCAYHIERSYLQKKQHNIEVSYFERLSPECRQTQHLITDSTHWELAHGGRARVEINTVPRNSLGHRAERCCQCWGGKSLLNIYLWRKVRTLWSKMKLTFRQAGI